MLCLSLLTIVVANASLNVALPTLAKVLVSVTVAWLLRSSPATATDEPAMAA